MCLRFTRCSVSVQRKMTEQFREILVSIAAERGAAVLGQCGECLPLYFVGAGLMFPAVDCLLRIGAS